MNKLLLGLFLSILPIFPVNALVSPQEQQMIAVQFCKGYQTGLTFDDMHQYLAEYLLSHDPVIRQLLVLDPQNQLPETQYQIYTEIDENLKAIRFFLKQLDNNCQY